MGVTIGIAVVLAAGIGGGLAAFVVLWVILSLASIFRIGKK